MYRKVYLSRAQTKASAIDHPIGDPTGGAAYGEFNDPVTAAVVGGTQIVGGIMGANAAEDAANIQAAAADRAAQQQREMFDIQNAQYAPYRGAGYQALNQIRGMLPGAYTKYDESGKPIEGTQTGSDYLTRQFTPEDFQAGIDPGYAFRLQQGQEATNRAANLGGGALSGNTLKAMQDYSQGLASQEYGNAFNRFQVQRQNIYNTLASIAGIGQGAQNTVSNLAANTTSNIGQLGVGAAAAQAAGTIGAANAYGGALGNVGQMYGLSQMLKPTGAGVNTGQNYGGYGGAASVGNFTAPTYSLA